MVFISSQSNCFRIQGEWKKGFILASQNVHSIFNAFHLWIRVGCFWAVEVRVEVVEIIFWPMVVSRQLRQLVELLHWFWCQSFFRIYIFMFQKWMLSSSIQSWSDQYTKAKQRNKIGTLFENTLLHNTANPLRNGIAAHSNTHCLRVQMYNITCVLFCG